MHKAAARLGRQIWRQVYQQKRRARPGFEPGTSRTLSENHTPRPTSLCTCHPSKVSQNSLPVQMSNLLDIGIDMESVTT